MHGHLLHRDEPPALEQTRHLLPRRELTGVAEPQVVVKPFTPLHGVGLCRAERDVDHRHLPAFHRDLFVSGYDRRNDVLADHRVHNPRLQVAPLHAGDGSVVFHSEENSPSVHVGERHDLSRELLRSDAVTLELGLRAFPGFDEFLEIGFQHGDGRPLASEELQEPLHAVGRVATPLRSRPA